MQVLLKNILILLKNLLKNKLILLKNKTILFKNTISIQNILVFFKDKLVNLKILFKKPLVYKSFIASMVVVSVFIITVITAKLTIDPNRYKAEIQQYIFKQTGQVVSLEGELQIQYFPFPALEARQVVLKELALTAEVLKIYPDFRSLIASKKYLEIGLEGVHFKSYFIPEFFSTLTFEEGFLELKNTQCSLIKNEQEIEMAINHLQIDTNNDKLRYVLTHHDQDFPLDFVMSIIGGNKKVLAGEKTNLKVALTAEGNTVEHIKKSLGGNIELEIEQGKFHGTDVIKTLEKAKSFMGTLASQFTQPLMSAVKALVQYESHAIGETPFNRLTMHAKIENGIFHNTLLQVDHHHYALRGSGHVNLHNNNLNYRIEAVYKEKLNKVYGIMRRKPKTSEKKRVSSSPLIINIKGHVKKPQIEPDFDSYLEFIK